MRILITGANGQLGRALTTVLQPHHTLFLTDLDTLDITDANAVTVAFEREQPDLVLHCAAYTNVDAAARDPHLAYKVNGHGTQNIALACARIDAALLYVSSNEVFDGRASQPYREFHHTAPINPYGYSKLAGEQFTRSLLRRFYIVRTSWLYAPGGRNFLHRIQELADQHGQLRVVSDEVANPTAVADLAVAIGQLITTAQYGIYHLVNAGPASRFDFAQEIMRLTGRAHVPITPVSLSDFQRDSTPPAYAPLENMAAAALGITLRPWQTALADYFAA